MAREVEFTREADEHFKRFTARERATLIDQIEKQLIYRATVETRNRKPMRPNPVAPWELRAAICACTMKSATIRAW